MEENTTIELPSQESALALSGDREENLKILSKQTGARVVLRGQDILIQGTHNQIEL